MIGTPECTPRANNGFEGSSNPLHKLFAAHLGMKEGESGEMTAQEKEATDTQKANAQL